MSDTRFDQPGHDLYGPFIAAAANRDMVRLKDGRQCRLIWWSKEGGYATVLLAGRHVKVDHSEVVSIV